MRFSMKNRVFRLGIIGAVAMLGVVGIAAPAEAHVPVLLTDANTVFTVDDLPLVLDGTTSIAFYGSTGRWQTRAMRIELKAGDQFHAELLIPALAPETTLSPRRLPRMVIVSPQHQVTVLANNERKAFFEPFTNTSYLTLGETTTVAQSGIYDIVVVGVAPTRFVAVTGQVEKFSASLENASVASLAQIQNWYRTPPQGY
ncbi:hypothetical protein IV500_20630 [Paeniglutamicibacter antarcticus]|uniref:Uncharacterized protein n=1 Tax=Arthrobacter terrae TaxID=2935737 RepID=A0A931CVL2_9MICC|nr:hypothetical protein [Arthrobacter terrae]MBG0741766.1 hypothetical protein [Arthrobacter terrae]